MLYKVEAPVKSWKKGLKKLDTAVEIKMQEDRDYHLQRIFYGLQDKQADPYSRNQAELGGVGNGKKRNYNTDPTKKGSVANSGRKSGRKSKVDAVSKAMAKRAGAAKEQQQSEAVKKMLEAKRQQFMQA